MVEPARIMVTLLNVNVETASMENSVRTTLMIVRESLAKMEEPAEMELLLSHANANEDSMADSVKTTLMIAKV